MKINIIKRNRKYFAATINGRKCKVLIDDNSQGLELGDQNLALDDISVSSKYGKDEIYKLSVSAEQQATAGICSLRTPFYNSVLVDKCRDLGGSWDRDEQAWIFPDFVEDEVEKLDEIYNSKLVTVEITFTERCSQWQGDFEIGGFRIASASGRDSGARLDKSVSLIKGRVDSGGSVKNWATIICQNSVVRMKIPALCLADAIANAEGYVIRDLSTIISAEFNDDVRGFVITLTSDRVAYAQYDTSTNEMEASFGEWVLVFDYQYEYNSELTDDEQQQVVDFIKNDAEIAEKTAALNINVDPDMKKRTAPNWS